MLKIDRHSPRVRVVAVLLACLIFSLTLVLLVAWSINRAVEDLEQASAHKLSLYQQILYSEVKRHEFLPYALSRNKSILALFSPSADPDLLGSVNRYLEEVSERTGAAAVYILNTEGLTLASSNWRSDKSYVGHNYGFRPYFHAAVRGGAGNYFAIGATTLTPGMFLSYPVESDGGIVGVVALKVSFDALEAAWAEQPAEKVVITNADGIVIVTSEQRWKFRTLAPLSAERRRQLLESRQFADHELPPLGLAPVRWLPAQGKVTRVATPPMVPPKAQLPSGYLVTQVSIPDSDWTLHLFAEMSPVWHRVVNALAIFGPTALALGLMVFYIIEHGFHIRERNAYQARAKADLEASEARKRAIIQSTRAALVTIDEEGVIESMNPTAEHFFAYTADEVKGRFLKDLLFETEHPAIDRYLADARRERGADFSLETRGRRSDGSAFFIDLILSDLYPHQGYRFIVTIHNITNLKAAEEKLRRTLEVQEERIRERTAELETSNRQLQHEIMERKRAEAVLREAQNDLIQAAKLAALGQMSAGITHELNQPLAAIRTFSASGRLLLQRQSFAQAEENFERIQKLTERMAKLTNQLKTFARKSTGEYLPVSIHTAVQQSLDLMASRIEQVGVQVTVDLPVQEVSVHGDQLRLEQVVINLLGNALDAMQEQRVRQLHLSCRHDATQLWLTVRDTGGGVPEAILPQIFDPFFTTKEVGEGLGLGLSIACGILRDWGGSLSVRNVEGGAEFTARLLRHLEPASEEMNG